MGEIVNWSVKIEDDVKSEIQQLLNDSGQQGKDFIAGLVTSYKINKVKASSPDAKADIEELQYHTARVNEIYYNLTSRVDANIRDIKHLNNEQLENKQVEIVALKEDIEKLREDIEENKIINQSIQQENKDYIKKLNEMESSNKLLEDLNNQYKEKVDTLSGLVNEYKQFKDDIVLVNRQLHEQQEMNRSVNVELEESNKQIESLREQQKGIQSKHIEDLKVKESSLMLEFGNRVLKLKEDQQEQLEKVRDEYNNKIKELLLQMQEQQVKVIEPIKENKK